MASADRLAGDAGVSVDELMANAGAAVARELRSRFPEARRALVLCGKGNNGGDGYVVARELQRELRVTVLEASGRPGSPAAAGARDELLEKGVRPSRLEPDAVRSWLEQVGADEGVVVDALLGSGLGRPLEGALEEVVRVVNAGAVPVVAIDVPTGVDADRATAPGEHVRADVTVQLAGAKVASAFHPARSAFSGARPGRPSESMVVDIGIPSGVLEEVSPTLYLDAPGVAAWLPRREATVHKYGVGTVTVVAGSRRYLGAAELTCRGAWRAGAGLVTLVADERHPAAWPETVHVAWPPEGGWPPTGLSARSAGAVVFGPGLDPHEHGSPLGMLRDVLDWAPGPVVLDAGALDPERLLSALPRAEGTSVITPHHGEAARLLAAIGSDVDIAYDPLGACRALAEATGAITVLKGPTTVIVAPDGREAVSDRGHPGMASGGTGDVLAGVLGALLAAPAGEAFERCCLSVFAHGRAGEVAAESRGLALIASDLTDVLPRVLMSIADAARAP